MNNSASEILPAWPTRWPQSSFGIRTLWMVLAAIGAGIVAIVLAIAAIAIYVAVSHAAFSMSDISTIVIPGLLAQLALEGAIVAVVLLMLPGVAKFSLRDLGFRALRRRDALYILGGVVAMFVLADGAEALVTALTHAKHEQDAIKILKALHGAPAILFFSTFAVVLAPAIEEIIFRVFLFNFGLRYWGFWAGAIFSGILFGLAHGDLIVAAPLALGGVVLAWVYYKTENAYASMITHALFNAVPTLLLIFAPKLAS